MLSIGWCMCHLLRRNNLFCTRYKPELSLPSTEDWILQRRMLIPSTQRAIIAPPPCMGSGREMALLGNHTNPIKLLLLTINYLKHYKPIFLFPMIKIPLSSTRSSLSIYTYLSYVPVILGRVHLVDFPHLTHNEAKSCCLHRHDSR